MMRALIYCLILLCLGASLTYLVQHDTGYILISYGDTSVEMRFWFGVFTFSIGLLLLWWCFGLIRRGLTAFGVSRSWWSESKQKRAERHTQRGLINFVEGNWRAAKKDLVGAAKLSDKPLVHYLAAARSAYELGEKEETRFLIQQAEKHAPENDLAVAISQARILLMEKQLEQCLAVLTRARANHGEHPVVLELLCRTTIQLRDWTTLVELLPLLAKYKVYDAEELAQLKLNAYLSRLQHLAATAKKEGDHVLIRDLHAFWDAAPKELKANEKLLFCYAHELIKAKLYDEAESILRAKLKKAWHPELVNLYGRSRTVKSKDQLTHAESWLKTHPEDAVLHLALGRIAIRNKLWGKARGYLEQSIKLRETPQAYAELAEVFATLGETKLSIDCYKRGLLLSAGDS
ncbi:metal-dependent phosphohydrolase [Saccharophagus degradans]|uniref:heme biosynthesis HemY N-terminal domain-containing protein n=1 Tax=Saccharophagus degradans TaxID=86304 RepID=UPI001C08AA61|nr:heme biosynthesis HemY N-terminal domain-containing protein [Saccharophagus degradans]MBU2985052.1 metal-dependent phosphohydrolase [Saccharophagus degradans]WGO98897.1 heme biosynthesis HemY N-terminal domain-containing protein [Saccharophagus degradans]